MDDLISRQAAIDAVNDITKWYCKTYHETRPTTIAVIDALKQLPSAQQDLQQTCNQLATDTISRQAAIDAIEPTLKSILQGNSFKAINVMDKIRELPSAQPTQTDTSNALKALDCVERRAAIEILYNFAGCIVDTPNGDYQRAYEASRHELEALPPAQSSPCEFCKHNDLAADGICLRCPAERREE